MVLYDVVVISQTLFLNHSNTNLDGLIDQWNFSPHTFLTLLTLEDVSVLMKLPIRSSRLFNLASLYDKGQVIFMALRKALYDYELVLVSFNLLHQNATPSVELGIKVA